VILAFFLGSKDHINPIKLRLNASSLLLWNPLALKVTPDIYAYAL
jgi:hypothetical protein